MPREADEEGVLSYPGVEIRGDRVARRWSVELRSQGPLKTDFGVVEEAIVSLIDAQRRSAFGSTANLGVLAPRVGLEEIEDFRMMVSVEYSPKGIVGDCEMICLWTPVRVIDVVWGIAKLQGHPRSAWRLMLP